MEDVQIEDIYPLTSVQQGILFHTLGDVGSGIFVEQLAITLNGPINQTLFHQAWQATVDRHPALRTSFIWKNRREPLQIVRKRAILPYTIHDWHGVPVDELRNRERNLVVQDRIAGFDLTKAPLMRINMIRISDTETRLVWTHHHIILDGFSFAIVLTEAVATYIALQSGTIPELLPGRPFSQYIAWTQRIDRPAIEAFWRSKLAVFTPTSIGIVHPRTTLSADPHEDGVFETALTADNTAAVLGSLRAQRATLATAIQAAWAAVIARYSGDDTVSMGVTSSGRPGDLQGSEQIVGMFANTIPLQIDVGPDQLVSDWLPRIQESASSTRQFEYVSPLELMNWSPSDSGGNLFESAVVVHNYGYTTQDIGYGDIKVTESNFFVRTDIPILIMAVPGERLTLQLIYDPTRVSATDAGRIHTHFVNLFVDLVTHPERPVRDLQMLTADELHQIRTWSQGPVSPISDTPVYQRFSKAAINNPRSPALASPTMAWSYRELDSQSNRLAHLLGRYGAGPEAIVALYLPRSDALVISILATLKSGAAFVVLDPRSPLSRNQLVVDQTDPVILITNNRCGAPPGTDSLSIINLDEVHRDLAAEDVTPPKVVHNPASLAYIVFTSGSTGRPKAVQIEHRSLTNFCAQMDQILSFNTEDVVLHFCAITFDVAISEILYTLVSGACLFIPDDEDLIPGPALFRLIVDNKITAATMTPSALEALPPGDMPSLRTLGTLGEACPASLVDRFANGRRFFNLYGPAEATILATAELCELSDTDPPIGSPLGNYATYVLDATGQPLPVGIDGQLYIGGSGVARGYLNDTERTASVFVDDPFSSKPGAKMYATGDKARLRQDGKIEYRGRFDHQLKVRGFRIEASEVEQAIRENTAVSQALVTSFNEGSNKQLIAYVTLEDDLEQSDFTRDAAEHVRAWRRYFDSTFTPDEESIKDPELNTAGWNSSVTRERFPSAEIRDWVEGTLSRIRGLNPARILEIGCGAGMFTLPLARSDIEILATDMSDTAINYVRAQLDSSDYAQADVTLRRQPANDFHGIPQDYFDLVIINSVVQYMPSVEYLLQVLGKSVQSLRSGGAVFIGDVRSLASLEEFHLHLALSEQCSDLTVRQLWQRVQEDARIDPELILHPNFFLLYAADTERTIQTKLLAKNSAYNNEMVGFRYDVVLQLDCSAGIINNTVPTLAWPTGELSACSLTTLIENDADTIIITGIPDARLAGLYAATNALQAGREPSDLHELRDQSSSELGPNLYELTTFAATLGYKLEPHLDPGTNYLTAILSKPGGDSATALHVSTESVLSTSSAPAYNTYVNRPLSRSRERRIVRDIREDLAGRLPAYLVPNSWVILSEFPLTAHGKIDRDGLPTPKRDQWRSEIAVYPRDSYEMAIARIWEDVLNISQVGVTDNFFHIGGHSLLAVTMLSRIDREFGYGALPPRAILENPTIEYMAKLIREGAGSDRSTALIPLRKSGKARPLFCVHPATGNSVAYSYLADRLGNDQPFYGLDELDLGVGSASIESMALKYTKLIRSVQESGPYRLGGLSFGGVVAYEVACQLTQSGETVELLAMFDSFVPRNRGSLFDRESHAQLLTKLAYIVEVSSGLDLSLLPEDLADVDKETQIQILLDAAAKAGIANSDSSSELIRGMIGAYCRSISALNDYTPGNYKGDMLLYRAQESLPGHILQRDLTPKHDDHSLDWSEFCHGHIEVVPAAGDHFSMLMPPHVDALATHLAAYLLGGSHLVSELQAGGSSA